MRRTPSLFDLLGVRPEDDAAHIRRAWRKKVKALHPDVAKNQKKSGEQLAQVNAAFDQLKTHTPFAERRRGDRRKTWRSTRIWSPAERAKKRAAIHETERPPKQPERRAQNCKAEAQQKQQREKAQARARRNAAALDRKEAAARARRAQSKRPVSKRPVSKQDAAAHKAARTGYAQARDAMSANTFYV
ncbi:MAG: J domain-containing protein [Pseudomonadota bacterium]